MSLQTCCCAGGNCDFYRTCSVAARAANANAGPALAAATVTGTKLCFYKSFGPTVGKLESFDNWSVVVNSISRSSLTFVSGCFWNVSFDIEWTVTAPSCSGCSNATLTRTTEAGFLFSCLPTDTVNFPYNCPTPTNRAIPERLYARAGTFSNSPLNNSFCNVAGSNVGLGGVRQGPYPWQGPGNAGQGQTAWTSVLASNYQTCADLNSGDLVFHMPLFGLPTYSPGFPFGCLDVTENNWDPLTGASSGAPCVIKFEFTLLTP